MDFKASFFLFAFLPHLPLHDEQFIDTYTLIENFEEKKKPDNSFPFFRID